MDKELGFRLSMKVGFWVYTPASILRWIDATDPIAKKQRLNEEAPVLQWRIISHNFLSKLFQECLKESFI